MQQLEGSEPDSIGFIRKRTANHDIRRKVRNWETWLAEPSTFTLEYPRRVSFFVSGGSATLVPLAGEEIVISAGDFVRIEPGATITWIVRERIANKFCYHDSLLSSALYRAKPSEPNR